MSIGMGAMVPGQLRRAVLGVAVAAGAFFIAHSLNAFIGHALMLPPAAATGAQTGHISTKVSYAPQQAAEDIRASGLFLLPAVPQGGGGGAAGAVGGGSAGSSGPAVRASIGAAAKIRLIGVVFNDRRGVFAIVEELSSKRQALYRLHEEIPDVGEVSEIHPDGMVVRQGGLEELLQLAMIEKPPPASAPGSPTAAPGPGAPLRKVVDRREVEQAMSDLPKLLTQARAVPNMVNGALNGFRIDYIAPASFYEKIGLVRGDVLQRVNGVEIRDPSTMFSLFQQLKNEQTVKLDLVRNNQRSTVTYELR
jgi:general secretion pathway protein C